ncbi:MAG: tRNA nucleotidyltransferase (CCA-adding enzyme), partial [Halieaceae bacterium]
MDVYLVGGAVRDKLLNYPVYERDWVVVGATPDQLRAQGYRQVGKDFPVFLHPKTNEEYALARTERKVGPGYTGFSCHSEPTVTLEEDLLRRDLTINAIAEDAAGGLIDPYGGCEDLEHKLLRHVSTAFTEDPLRVLRTARFAARYHHMGFTVAPETEQLMAAIVAAGELQHLARERVWVEMERALGERSPWIFIEVLRACGALAALLPEVDALFGVPQTEKHHPEIDTGIHVMMALQQAVRLNAPTTVRFAVLLHDLGKGTTPPDEWPRHIAHEHRGLKLVEQVCKRLRVPNKYRELALHVCQYHTHSHRADELKPSTVLKTLEATNALRRPERFAEFLLACEADARGRLGKEDQPYPQKLRFERAQAAASAVDTTQLQASGLEGREFGKALRELRLA